MIPPEKWEGKEHLDKWGEKLQDQDTEDKEKRLLRRKTQWVPVGQGPLAAKVALLPRYGATLFSFLGSYQYCRIF